MDQVLELKNIHYAYHNPDGETPAINGISFILNKGEFVAIVGPSGCGKSTDPCLPDKRIDHCMNLSSI